MKRKLLICFSMIAIASATTAQTLNTKASKAEEDKEVLLKLTDELTTAKMKRDLALLGRLLADDYIFTNPAGLFANKAEYLDGAKADTAVYESVKNYDKVAKVYGDAGVVAGLTTVKGSYDGHEIGGQFRFTNMFVKRQDNWQCIAIHLTRIATQ
ncbi:MAG TPA: nuclear transport factor 2 family protein [Blastocatellia bacterium]|nr:nuclear transport factor 2 family protein [Blastocatellia bacterium]